VNTLSGEQQGISELLPDCLQFFNAAFDKGPTIFVGNTKALSRPA
jgi:hypothetical protein